ncbi:MAG: sugar ABC transporter ATP-binding protein [Gammaproteobacteria bacterium]|nr:sugar ABC transporter ATP-binding protein [Gammaproteobacteria bacterium]
MELQNVSKSFSGIEALKNVSCEIFRGEVLCLLGDNGAGKSTLIKVLSGFHQPTSGTMHYACEEVVLPSPRSALERGIATVHQEVGTVPLISVGRNFFLGSEPTKRFGPLKIFDSAKANAVALEQMRSFGITRVTNGNQLVGTLSGGERQVLAIARAIYFGAQVLILDEPTSALGVKEAAKVLVVVNEVRKQGIGVVFITHNVRHAMAVGNQFVVLIHGQVEAKFRRGEKSRDEILNLMAGGEQMEELEAELSALEDSFTAPEVDDQTVEQIRMGA